MNPKPMDALASHKDLFACFIQSTIVTHQLFMSDLKWNDLLIGCDCPQVLGTPGQCHISLNDISVEGAPVLDNVLLAAICDDGLIVIIDNLP